jgi:branched-chain amino acid transport system ATP-binding protein
MADTPLLEVDHVTRRFGGVTALNDVSLSVPEGRIIGVIGPNGAGKTTVFNVITGAYPPSSGEVRFAGRSLSARPSHRIAQSGIARTFQNLRLFASMTVLEHLIVAQQRAGLLSSLLPVRLGDRGSLERAEEVLQFFGLQDHRNRLARELPYGLQRKVEMARALSMRPRLLLLDEPVAGMTHEETAEVAELLQRLKATGVALLLIEHDMTFVMGLCDYLYVLDFGQLIAQGPPEEVRRNPAVLDAYLGADA